MKFPTSIPFTRWVKPLFTGLRFEPEVEAAFLDDYFEKTILRTRTAVILGLVVYSLYHILDYLVVPDVKSTMMWIRFGFVAPVILILFLTTFMKLFRCFNQILISLGVLASGGGIVAMTNISPHYTAPYYAGIIIVLIYCYMIMGLRFYWASAAGGTVVLAYVASIHFLTDLPVSMTINNYFFLIGSNIMLMFGSYFTEMLRRRDFQLRYQLHQEGEKIESINADLEFTIAKRTSELELEVATRKVAQQSTQKALKEKEILLKEVYHRTKNNMNVVISLLNLQSMEQDRKPSKDVLEQISRRIYSMSLVHEQLYRSDDLATIRLDKYLPTLVFQLRHSFANTEGQVQFNFDCEAVELDLEQAVPVGLALNEIITNAFKHSFPDGRKGSIDFQMQQLKSGLVRINIRNDGVDLPGGIDTVNPESLGLRLIHLLIVEQLGGNFTLSSENGVVYTLELLPNT